jgi:hypothetical protein
VTLAPDALYLNDPECLLIVFDLRAPGAAAALDRQRVRWAEYSDVEALDEDHFALIVWPGWVSESAA